MLLTWSTKIRHFKIGYSRWRLTYLTACIAHATC